MKTSTLTNLTKIFDATTSNVYAKNYNGVYLMCNNSTVKTLGLHNPGDIVGKTDSELEEKTKTNLSIHQIKHNDLMVIQRKAASLFKEEIIIKNKKITFLSYKTPIIDPKNKTAVLFGISDNEQIIQQENSFPAKLPFTTEEDYEEEPNPRLTLTEIKITKLIIDGINSKEIAKILNVSPGTVSWHRENIYKKLKVKTAASCALAFMKLKVNTKLYE